MARTRRFVQQKSTKAFFRALVQTFLCTAYCFCGKAAKKRRNRISCLGVRAFARSFRKAFPVLASDCASAPSERTSHFTVPFLRRGIAPRSSVLRAAAQSRVPKYANILFSIKSYTNEQLYAFILFCQAVNGIMAKTEAYRTVLILSAAFCLRAHGAGQNATFEH